MDSLELLPCPFCGKVLVITKHFKIDAYSLLHRCKVVGPIHFEWSDKEFHVHRWNTRTP